MVALVSLKDAESMALNRAVVSLANKCGARILSQNLPQLGVGVFFSVPFKKIGSA